MFRLNVNIYFFHKKIVTWFLISDLEMKSAYLIKLPK